MSSTSRVKEIRDSEKWSCKGEDQSWPLKKYYCTFCKREFKSAQALGGHMNVHRRDRARLRQLHSWLLQTPKSNPNPNFTSSNFLSPSSGHLISPYPVDHMTTLPLLNTTPSLNCFSSSASSATTYKGKLKLPEYPRTDALATRKKNTVRAAMVEAAKSDKFKNDMVTSLNLEKGSKNKKELLDLELRL